MKITISLPDGLMRRFRRFLALKYRGNWWGMQSKEIGWAIEEYLDRRLKEDAMAEVLRMVEGDLQENKNAPDEARGYL